MTVWLSPKPPVVLGHMTVESRTREVIRPEGTQHSVWHFRREADLQKRRRETTRAEDLENVRWLKELKFYLIV